MFHMCVLVIAFVGPYVFWNDSIPASGTFVFAVGGASLLAIWQLALYLSARRVEIHRELAWCAAWAVPSAYGVMQVGETLFPGVVFGLVDHVVAAGPFLLPPGAVVLLALYLATLTPLLVIRLTRGRYRSSGGGGTVEVPLPG